MKKNDRKRSSDYANLSSLGIQMVAIIGIFVYLGYRLDGDKEGGKPWFTLGFSLLGVLIAMIYMIRTVTKEGKK